MEKQIIELKEKMKSLVEDKFDVEDYLTELKRLEYTDSDILSELKDSISVLEDDMSPFDLKISCLKNSLAVLKSMTTVTMHS